MFEPTTKTYRGFGGGSSQDFSLLSFYVFLALLVSFCWPDTMLNSMYCKLISSACLNLVTMTFVLAFSIKLDGDMMSSVLSLVPMDGHLARCRPFLSLQVSNCVSNIG